jgi:hypothetical protein
MMTISLLRTSEFDPSIEIEPTLSVSNEKIPSTYSFSSIGCTHWFIRIFPMCFITATISS